MLLNSSGSVTLTKKVDHASDSITLNAITTSADGFIYMAGSIATKMVIVKITTAGNMEWIKYYEYGSNVEAYSISKATTGNGVIVTGKSNDAVIVVIEVDSEGDLAF